MASSDVMPLLRCEGFTLKATSIDLFSGAGGLTCGFEQAGWETIAAVEIDADSAQSYSRNFPRVEVLNTDVRQVDFSKWRDQADIVAGGPPCQPFSVAGLNRAMDDPRDCIPEFLRAVREIEPKGFVLENVAGLAGSRHRHYLQLVLASFMDLGYLVRAEVLDAANYGAPQHRRRLIIIGQRCLIPGYPVPTHGPRAASALVTAGEALSDVPQDAPNRAIVTYAKSPILRPQPFDGMLVNGGGRPINLAEPSQTIPASAGGNRTHIVDRENILVEYHKYLMGGGRPKSGIVSGVRRLTVAESARLQSFPDTFVFLGQQSSRYRQVGNAVPPRLARAVGEKVLASLSGTDLGSETRPYEQALFTFGNYQITSFGQSATNEKAEGHTLAPIAQ